MFGKTKRQDLVTVLQNFSLILLGVGLLWLGFSQNIAWYVRPDYHGFSFVMGVLSLFFGYAGFWTAPQHTHHEEKTSSFKTVGVFTVLFVLSLYLMLFHRSALSPLAANNRGVNQNAVTGTGSLFTDPSLSPLLDAGKTEEYTLADWVRLFRVNPDPWSHKGKKVKVVGFVQKVDEGHFYISRFVISCCTVDASPIGLLVRSSDHFSDGKWLEVQGVLDVAHTNEGVKQPVLVPEKVQEINEPEQPYLY